MTARIDDAVFNDVPISSNPNRERDLLLRDENGLRGRPHGSFFRWKLNEFGFRGPEIPRLPKPDTKRVFVLGASESFGLYESSGREYPAVLQRRLSGSGLDVEVVNAASAGMALPTMLQFWKSWASGFKPDLVVIYPTPEFYLDDEAPRPPVKGSNPVPGALSKTRLGTRVVDLAKKNELLRRARVHWIDAKPASREPFTGVPQDRLQQFQRDLEAMIDAVTAAGARPVLVTHAFKTPRVPERRDIAELQYYLLAFQRASPELVAEFDYAAREVVMDAARRNGCEVVDASAALSGRRELFADPVHFNDEGSDAMAALLAEALRPLLDGRGSR